MCPSTKIDNCTYGYENREFFVKHKMEFLQWWIYDLTAVGVEASRGTH